MANLRSREHFVSLALYSFAIAVATISCSPAGPGGSGGQDDGGGSGGAPAGGSGGGQGASVSAGVGGQDAQGGSASEGISAGAGGLPLAGGSNGGAPSVQGGSGSGGATTAGSGGSATTGGNTGVAGAGGMAPAGGASPPAPSEGCGSGAGLPDGSATISAGGMNRTYVLRLPQGYSNAKPWPLVFALHPNGQSTAYWDAEGGARPLRALLRDKAILVLGQARMGDWRGDLPADLAYFEALMVRLKGSLCVDTKRIFSMGFSGGGSFSGVLGCRRDDVRAIATAGAVTYFEEADCVGKPAAWISIGQGETNNARTSFRDHWRTSNGCQPMTTNVMPSPCVAYACPANGPVHFCSHPGGHEWPAFGTEAAWAFFSRF